MSIVSNISFDTDAMDNMLNSDGLDWTFEKPTDKKYSIVYIIEEEEDSDDEEEYVEYKVYFSPNIDETVEDGCWDYLSCPKRITEEAEIIEWIEENDCCSIDEIELKEEAPINLWDSLLEQQQKDILHSQSVWKIYFGAVLQDIREPNWREEEKEQYKKVCDEDDCDTILDIDTPIMCYMNKHNGDKTLCRDCYVDGGYKEIDENSDNEDSDSDDEEEEENTCWCEVGEHRVSELDMWKDFADCKNCVSEKEMLERTVDDEED